MTFGDVMLMRIIAGRLSQVGPFTLSPNSVIDVKALHYTTPTALTAPQSHSL